MDERFSRRTASTFEDLSICRQECNAFLAGQNISEEVLYAVNLVIEEIVTNTIKYGYKGESGRFIDVDVSLQSNELTLEIIDEGPAFDPFSYVSPHEHLPLIERPIGGLGLSLVKNLMDTCAYRRDGERNVMFFTKRLG